MRILVVDDEAELLELLARALRSDGHRVETASTVTAARAALFDDVWDVVVLDLGLPDGSGLELCREAREARLSTPMLVLTAQNSVEDRVESLDTGADDFLAKPFAVAELKARIRALGRRKAMPPALSWRRANVSLDFSRRVAKVDELEVPVTAREWNILEVLSLSAGRVVSRARLLDEVWGREGDGAGSSLEVLITRIRRKLGSDVVRTIRGEGYALE